MELSRTTRCHLLVNSCFSVIPAGTRSIVNMGHSFGGPDGLTKLGVAYKGQPCDRVNTKMLPIGCPVTIVTKNLEHFRKNEFWAKKLHFRPKILHFYATHIKTPFFRTWLIGTIGPPYPESPLDNFCFPVSGCLASWQAVSWPKLPKVTLLGPKMLFFGLNSFFCGQPQKHCYNHDGTPKRQPF